MEMEVILWCEGEWIMATMILGSPIPSELRRADLAEVPNTEAGVYQSVLS